MRFRWWGAPRRNEHMFWLIPAVGLQHEPSLRKWVRLHWVHRDSLVKERVTGAPRLYIDWRWPWE